MNLFAYGTLMDREVMTRVSGGGCRSRDAVLHDYDRKKVRGELFPGIVGRQGGCVDGVLYVDLTPRAFERLDRFEGPLYLRTPVRVTCGDGLNVEAQAYVVADKFLDRLSEEDWSFRRFLRDDKDAFMDSYPGYEQL